MTWINLSRYQGSGAAGVAASVIQSVAARVGSNYRSDIFWVAPNSNPRAALSYLVSCWQNNSSVNIMQMTHAGQPVVLPFNYNTDSFSFAVAPGDVFAIPKDWVALPSKCNDGNVVDKYGKTISIVTMYTVPPRQQQAPVQANTVYTYTPATATPATPPPTYTKAAATPYTPTPAPASATPAATPAATPTPTPVPASQIAPTKASSLPWIIGGLAVAGAGVWYFFLRNSVRSNPNRPPSRWMHDCESDVGRGYDPGRVCGSLWYHKMSPAQRRAALRRDE